MSASTDLQQMPRKNLDQMSETLTVSDDAEKLIFIVPNQLFLFMQNLSRKLETYSVEMSDLITKSESTSNDDLKNNLLSLKGKLDSLILRTNHQISVTKVRSKIVSTFNPFSNPIIITF
jgi:hypothetical protein